MPTAKALVLWLLDTPEPSSRIMRYNGGVDRDMEAAMITRIELDGFKTFRKFKIELASLGVIVGANGAGKSNLFDALRLLSKLAEVDLRTAFQDLRGEAGELFTIIPGEKTVGKMDLAVEMLIDKSIRDSWGAEAELRFTRLRYELTIERKYDDNHLERLYVIHEQLTAIPREDDSWIKRNIGKRYDHWLPSLKSGRNKPFISTEIKDGISTIYVHQDGHGGRKASVADKVERTILSGVVNTEFPHAFAAREEMRSWKFLQLNPEVLRQPSSMLSSTFIGSDGSNLPSTVARMQAEDPLLLNDISRDLANLVPGIANVMVEADKIRNRYIVSVKTQDGNIFSSRVLSDGTLRLLSLVTLKHDPQHRGVLCFEEPENGVHPFRIQQMAKLLRDLTTNFSKPEQSEWPIRQLIVNTHSPVFIGQKEVYESLLFAYMPTLVSPNEQGDVLRVTRIVPVYTNPQTKMPLDTQEEEMLYTIDQVIKYLSSSDNDEVIEDLRGRRVA